MADNERTPLLTIVSVRSASQRYPNSTVRRICSFLLFAVLLIVVLLFLLFQLVIPDCVHLRRHSPRVCLGKHSFSRNHGALHSTLLTNTADGIAYDELLDILADTPDEKKIREWSQYYTSGPHLAGKNLSQAEWTRDRWQEFGIHADIVSYPIYTSYPISHRLALLEKVGKSTGYGIDSGKDHNQYKITHEASLKEDVLKEDRTSGLEDRIPTFHGYGANGNVTASYVYCNYGSFWDFEDLVAANVSLAGKIALVRYGRVFRGLKVKIAQEMGMIGVVMYSDPGNDGKITEENGYKAYPNGPARNPSSVQRGSVQWLSYQPGDPTTPGYPSKEGCPRVDANLTTPSIPSLPISYLDALPLLKALNGHGPLASSMNEYWQGGGLGYKGVEYSIGPTPDNVVLNLFSEQEFVITPQWNVIGVINGTLSDEVVILGNHRDAWGFGASDPNSGSAALNEVVRSFGVALSRGWKPLRSIVFASWDGEEYGLLGSTEWVEEYVPWLKETAVSYLNLDTAVSGPVFSVAASPLLNQAIVETTKLVYFPNQTIKGQTVYDVWDKIITAPASGSDYTAFQDFAGIPIVNLGFGRARDGPVRHYHSNYDSFDWMEKFGDPKWTYHTTAARLLSLLVARIIEMPIIPFNATIYAESFIGYLEKVKNKAADTTFDLKDDGTNSQDLRVSLTPDAPPVDFAPLNASLTRFYKASVDFDAKAAALQDKILKTPLDWWQWWERVKLYYAVRQLNDKYKWLDRQFLYNKGLDKRPWYKHVVFAPNINTTYSASVFPSLAEAIDEKNIAGAYKWIGIITAHVTKAAELLER